MSLIESPVPTRALASLQIVENVIKHPDANLLEISRVLGWDVITRLGEVKTGDKVVYIEIDSLLEVGASWIPEGFKKKARRREYLSGQPARYLVRTIKLRGEWSQGLIIHLKDFTGVMYQELSQKPTGSNVTELLNILKYEPPMIICRGRQKKGVPPDGLNLFPVDLLRKTDEPRIQSHPYLLQSIIGNPSYTTIKMDGTSATYILTNNAEFLVCSRNYRINRPEDISKCSKNQPYWPIAVKYEVERKLRSYERPIAIQGEICGPFFNRNLAGLKEIQLYVFNVIDIADGRRLGYPEFFNVCSELGLPTVPIAHHTKSFDKITIPELLKQAEGTYEGTKNPREGLVIRHCTNEFLSFKVINNAYLLKIGG